MLTTGQDRTPLYPGLAIKKLTQKNSLLKKNTKKGHLYIQGW